MKHRFLLTAFLLLLFGQVWAQGELQPAIEFEESTHDFGTLKKGDPAVTVFKFKNISDREISLTQVKPACGCTSPTWTKDPIPKGGTGEIKVSYNSERVGPFNKSVRVVVDSLSQPMNIFIRGNVVDPNPAVHTEGDGHDHSEAGHNHTVPTPINIDYSIPRGALAFEKMIENLKNVTSEGKETVSFRFKNTSDGVVRIVDVNGPKGFTYEPQDRELKPGQETKLTVTVDGGLMKINDQPDGYFSERVNIVTDEPSAVATKSMTINGNYQRIFTPEEKANSAHILFDAVEVEGGKVIEGEEYKYDYKFTNTGKSNLVIYSVKPSCGCTATASSSENLAPGETATITATFNSQGRPGIQSKTITVKSNDVDNPIINLKFTVEVVKDPFHAGGVMGGSN